MPIFPFNNLHVLLSDEIFETVCDSEFWSCEKRILYRQAWQLQVHLDVNGLVGLNLNDKLIFGGNLFRTGRVSNSKGR